MENGKLKRENEKQDEFNFWKFMLLMFLGLLILTSIVVGIPYLLSK